LKIALIALSVRGAMGHYIDALVTPLSKHVELHLFVPEHYTGKSGMATVHFFATGLNKSQALYRLINPYLALHVWKSIENVEPNVVHIFNGEGYPWSLLWAYWASKTKLPIVFTVHDPEPHPGNILELINSYLRRFTLTRATKIHIHSQRFLQAITQQGVLPERVSIIPIGSIADRFVCHRRGDIFQERAALFFGRLEAYKGLDILVEAGLFLKGELRVIIAGPGDIPNTILQTIQTNPEIFELHNRYLSEDEVANLFQRASVCVLPYRQATQSQLPLIAAAFGVPLVATSVGGFLEDVPLVNGLLVPPGNPKALAEGIQEGVGRTPYYPKEYEFEVLVEKFVHLYKCVCREF
jgi:glycosyltransferase involved in cell wall biosynthesis